MKILLAEDEPDLGTIIQKNLTNHQYIVDRALNGMEAWDCLTNSQATKMNQ